MQNPLFIHTVYFWLKENTSEEVRLSFEAGLKKLGESKYSTAYYWGTPLDVEARDVVDDSYDYGSTTFFDSVEDHDIYQNTDPIHMEFINSHKQIWKDVKVYDHKLK